MTVIGEVNGGCYGEHVHSRWIIHEDGCVREPTEFEIILIEECQRLRSELRRPLSRGDMRQGCEQCGEQREEEIQRLVFKIRTLEYQVSNRKEVINEEEE